MKSECWWILNTLQCWCFPCSGKIGAQSCSDPRSALTPCPENFHHDYELQWTIMMHQLSNHYPKSCPWSFIWSWLWLLMMGWGKKVLMTNDYDNWDNHALHCYGQFLVPAHGWGLFFTIITRASSSSSSTLFEPMVAAMARGASKSTSERILNLNLMRRLQSTFKKRLQLDEHSNYYTTLQPVPLKKAVPLAR